MSVGIWERKLLNTTRGVFEIFIKGEGRPVCVAHHYSVFNQTGDYFAESLTNANRVFLVNLRETGNSEEAKEPYQLSMLETIFDLEAIREELELDEWGFAGHSTGGMLGVIYGIYFSNRLSFNLIVGAAAREYMTFSKDCIYNSNHPKFFRMQELNETLKCSDLTLDKRNALKTERTKLSLYEPENYDALFSRDIIKGISAIRMDFFNREVQVYDVTKKLELISCPTLIICGRYDVQCPVKYSIEMHDGIANSKLVIFEKSNHYPFLEEAERFKIEYKLFIKEYLQ
ncbi:alpha/beta hydrolase [Virgibacillus halodenitrificans]|uniref:alpha/beta fold hydrolase n=1 Tax=Virgibacillus halodenitrificans TaxID=1482 RepID=UPI001FB3BFEB|nr:alpha/beta hydrolase [Virgibacillus halodenitrificans]MCJ0930531.1 alpha/beta hydrolase [Virgibacillus halodenitrificans]